MALSWKEIRTRALKFSKEWESETNERAEAKSFWDDFFNIFGISRRRIASFEKKVTRGNRADGYIDLLWKGQMLIEHKSSGKNLDRAYKQAIDYFPGLQEYDLPKYILVCNFQSFSLYDLEEDTKHEFLLRDLVKNIYFFDFIAGYQKKIYKEEDPVNIKAAELMGKLHDSMANTGYQGHHLEVYLVRLLFCLFADDTSIFEKGTFVEYIENRTNSDGSDLAMHLSQIFEVLNTPNENRLSNLDEILSSLPYINGKLFDERLPFAAFDFTMRKTLLNCCQLNWSKISPAIFGSLFQSVMNPAERRNLGAHYTSEKNILRLIRPLFIDNLWSEFHLVKNNRIKLSQFHDKISSLTFLDPACGCGNFLVITYRELRLIEIEIIKILHKGQYVIDISHLVKLNVDKLYGIEYEDFPAQIAQVALWLIDHQMNMKLSEIFGEYFVRLPLNKSAIIIKGNALRLDWQSLLLNTNGQDCPRKFDFILGNPPFVGKQYQNIEQKSDLKYIFDGVKGSGVLDYVACWYKKAADYLRLYSSSSEGSLKNAIKVAFVSTNSIAQGEQVGILWNELFNRYSIKIHFAHNTFKWSNEARGNAGVYVVIIGFANFDVKDKYLYEYESIISEPHVRKVKNINPYLVESDDFVILKRTKPICPVPEISFGSMPNDGGNLLLSDIEKNELVKSFPRSEDLIRPLISTKEYLNGEKRWCLWLKGVEPSEYNHIPEIVRRVHEVKKHRFQSKRITTNTLSDFPTLFAEDRQPTSKYIFIPLTTSENRIYIPFAFFDEHYIANNSASIIPTSTYYHFGIISSVMHMIWLNYVGGKLEGRYRYSNDIVYNNFPWPFNPSSKLVERIEHWASKVLAARKNFPNSTLSDLYDPVTMPPELVSVHKSLDNAVDLAYRSQPFGDNTKRIEFLFSLYKQYTSDLFKKSKN
jgi:hypothetical protein